MLRLCIWQTSLSRWFAALIFTVLSFQTAALDVSIVSTADTLTPDSDIYHRIIVANRDGQTRDNVILRVNVPANTFFGVSMPTVSSGCFQSCDSSETARWDLGDMSDGEVRVIEIRLTASASAATNTSLTVQAAVAHDDDADAGSAQKSFVLNDDPVVSINIAAQQQLLRRSEVVEVDIQIGNIGDDAITSDPQFSVAVPDTFTFVSASDGGELDSGTVTWDLPTLNRGVGLSRKLRLRSSASVDSGRVFTITGVLSNSDGEIGRSQDAMAINTGRSLTLTGTVLSDVSQSSDISYYRYVISNTGSTDSGVIRLHKMAAARTFFGATAPVVSSGCFQSCDSAEWATWNLGEIGAGESRVVTVPMQRSSSNSPIDGEVMENHVSVSEDGEHRGLNLRTATLSESSPDFDLVLSPDKARIDTEDTVRYQLSYGNIGDDARIQTTLSMPVPDGLVFSEASDGGSLQDGSVVWSIGTLNPGVGGHRWATFTTGENVTEAHTVRVSASVADEDGTIMRSSDSLVVAENPSLTLTATVLSDLNQSSDIAYFRYVIANNSSVDSGEINVRNIAAPRTFFSATAPAVASGCFQSCDPVEWGRWELGVIDAGESRVITVPVYRFNSGGPVDGEVLESQVSVSVDGDHIGLTARPTMLAESSETFDLVLSPDKARINVDDTVSFQLSYGNISDDPRLDTTLTMPVPEGLVFVAASDGGSLQNGVIVWQIGTLNPGVGGHRWAHFETVDGLSEARTIWAGARAADEDGTIMRSADSLVVTENPALTLTATVLSDLNQPGDVAYYRYVIANTSTVDSGEVRVRNIAAARTFYSATAPSVTDGCFQSCDSAEWGRWNIGVIDAGDSRVITVPVYRASSSSPLDGEVIESQVSVSVDGDHIGLTARPTMVSESSETFDLALSPDKARINADDTVRYQLSYGNISDDPRLGTVLTMPVPTGLAFVAASDDGVLQGNNVVWNVGTLNPGVGGNRWASFDTTDSVTEANTIRVDARIADEDGTIVRSADSLVVADNQAMTLTATVLSDVMLSGDNTHYRFMLTNTSTVDSGFVRVRTNPARRTAFSAAAPSVSDGCFQSCDPTEWGRWNIGVIEAGESRVVSFPVIAFNSGGPLDGEVLESQVSVSIDGDHVGLTARPTVIYEQQATPEIVLTTSRSIVQPGETFTVTLNVGNSSDDTLENGMVSLAIPNQLEFVEASWYRNAEQANWNAVADTVHLPTGNLLPGDWLNGVVTVQAKESLSDGQVIALFATLNDDERSIARSYTTLSVNDTATLQLSVSDAFESPLAGSSTIDTTITADNESGLQRVGARILMNAPVRASFTHPDLDSGCFQSCDSLEWGRWNLGEIDAGNSEVIALTQTVATSPIPGDLSVAHIYLDFDSSPTFTQAVANAYGIGDLSTVSGTHDSDADGIPDWWELLYGFNYLNANDANSDLDRDGFVNLVEFQQQLNPLFRDPPQPIDTDGDGVLDNVEQALGMDINSDDSDNDGIPDSQDNQPTVAYVAQAGIIDVHEVGDVNADGQSELAVVSIADNVVTITLRRAADFSLLNSISLATLYQEVSSHISSDLNGNDVGEVVVYGMRTEDGFEGRPQATAVDLATLQQTRQYNWPKNWTFTVLHTLSDLDGDDVGEIAIEGRSLTFSGAGRPQLIVRNGATSRGLYNFGYPNIYDAPRFVELADMDFDGIPEIGTYGVKKNNGKFQVKVASGVDPGDRLRSYNFPANWDNPQWIELDDSDADGVNDWGMFGTRKDDSRPQVLNKNGVTPRGIMRIYAWPGDMAAPEVQRVPDLNDDGIDEVGVVGLRANNRYQFSVKDGLDRSATLANYGWPNNWQFVSFHTLGDQTGDGASEVALYGRNTLNQWELVIRSGVVSEGEVRRINLTDNWLSKPALQVIDDINGDDVNDLMLVGKNSLSQDIVTVISGATGDTLY